MSHLNTFLAGMMTSVLGLYIFLITQYYPKSTDTEFYLYVIVGILGIIINTEDIWLKNVRRLK
jgi:hypothetical protein